MKCVEDEIPFELPPSWSWCRLGVLFAHNTGKALNSSDTTGTRLTYITTSNLYWDRFELDSLKEMPFTESEIEKCTVRKGDLLVCEGGDIGRSAIWLFDDEIRIQNHIHRLRSYIELSNRFYYYVMYLWKRMERIGGQGIGLQGFSSKALHKLIVPLPPVNEQFSVVEKLDSILGSVDAFDELNAEFIVDVECIKKQILDLAIRGKLVPQNPGDEPASILLERIRAEKEELIKQGKIKRDKKESVIFKGEDNSYYEKYGEELPQGWVVTNLETLLSYEQPTDYIVESTDYSNNYSTPVLTAGKSFVLGYTNETNGIYKRIPTIIFDDFTTESKYVDFEFKVKSSAMKILTANTDLVLIRFAYYLMQSIEIDHDNHQRYWISVFSKQEVALPPLAEQQRIVEMIDYLYSLLDNMLL